MKQTPEVKAILKEIDRRKKAHAVVMKEADLHTLGGDWKFDASARQREELIDLHSWITNPKR